MSRQALEMALEFIQRVNKDGWILADFEPEMYNTITAIREALAQPEQEPVCDKDPQGCWSVRCQLGNKCKNNPPQRTWVGLTVEEVDNITAQRLKWQVADLVDAMEEALRRKNNG